MHLRPILQRFVDPPAASAPVRARSSASGSQLRAPVCNV